MPASKIDAETILSLNIDMNPGSSISSILFTFCLYFLILITKQFSCQPVEKCNPKHLLMRQTETCSICYLLTRFDRQVRTNCPIRSKKQCHNDQHSDSICQKRRTGKHNQPVSSRCLLYLYITCSKKVHASLCTL